MGSPAPLVIFARWRFWLALWRALLFGRIEALVPRLGAAGIRGLSNIVQIPLYRHPE